ncbi:MAG TPA: thioredoxin family protein [Hyphomonadaceae bacterium]|nr:thioredoxin family protein [Hyphomonadaceae bacterium]
MMGKVATRKEWLKARTSLLAAEKEFTHQRDALSAKRRAMPWVKVDTDYTFDTPTGPMKLADLFAGRSQLLVYHFMFAPESEWGCKSCSFWADQFDGAIPHLNARDASFVAISRAPLDKLQRHANRLGWQFPWVSSGGSTFNYDFAVSFEPDANGEATYNYKKQQVPFKDLQGFSAFVKGDDGAIYHAYSTYGRGQDITNGAYNMLDLMPKGRDEDALPFSMAWVKFSDEYGESKL